MKNIFFCERSYNSDAQLTQTMFLPSLCISLKASICIGAERHKDAFEVMYNFNSLYFYYQLCALGNCPLFSSWSLRCFFYNAWYLSVLQFYAFFLAFLLSIRSSFHIITVQAPKFVYTVSQKEAVSSPYVIYFVLQLIIIMTLRYLKWQTGQLHSIVESKKLL